VKRDNGMPFKTISVLSAYGNPFMEHPTSILVHRNTIAIFAFCSTMQVVDPISLSHEEVLTHLMQ
jgi:hypothetical protein